MREGAQYDLFSIIDTRGPYDAVLLLTRTGTLLGAWARDATPMDVVSVMAATLLGSVETMVQAFCHGSPRSVRVETDACQMLATKLGRNDVLVLIAGRAVPAEELRRASRGIAARMLAPSASPAAPQQVAACARKPIPLRKA